MKKVIRDERGYPLGWTNTTDKRGTFNEFIDGAKYTHQGYVRETLASLNRDERDSIKDKGELW